MTSRRATPADTRPDAPAPDLAPVAAPAPAAPPQDPQVGGRFERLPDGSLRRLD